MIASEILMLIGSTTITILKGPNNRSETRSMLTTKLSHSVSNSR